MARTGELQNLTVAITERCNLACRLCYVGSSPRAHRELGADFLRELMSTVARSVTNLVFTGGEPFLHPDIDDLLSYASDLFARVAVTTNGIDVADHTLAAVRRSGAVLAISIDGMESTHDKNRGTGSFARTIQTIARSREAGIPIALQSIIGPESLSELDQLVALARDHGVVNLAYQRTKLRGRARRGGYFMSADTYRDFVAEIHRRQAANPDVAITIKDALFNAREEVRAWSGSVGGRTVCGGCRAGMNYLYVDAAGDVRVCPFIPETIGNVHGMCIYDIWRKAPLIAQLRRRESYQRCSHCAFWPVCRGCRAEALSWNGSLFGRDPCCWQVMSGETG